MISNLKYIYAAILLYVAGFVFVPGYHQPAALFWDENYHIPSAQKYLDGVMYMEPHPPLGKLLIALVKGKGVSP
jgi:dolichyl-phosphate-mannose--protein O-mannosyl transferase